MISHAVCRGAFDIVIASAACDVALQQVKDYRQSWCPVSGE